MRSIRQFLVFVFLLFPVLAFAGQRNILVVGDSLSAGYGIDVKQGWVVLLEKRLKKRKLNYRVINASVSGDTTSNGLMRLTKDLKKYHPVIVIIALGGNDGLRGLSLKNTETNLSKMIQLSKMNKAQVLLVGVRLPPNYGPVYTSKFQQIFAQLSEKYDVVMVPKMLTKVGGDSQLMQADGIHPNAKAQPIILRNIWKKLYQMLKE